MAEAWVRVVRECTGMRATLADAYPRVDAMASALASGDLQTAVRLHSELSTQLLPAMVSRYEVVEAGARKQVQALGTDEERAALERPQTPLPPVADHTERLEGCIKQLQRERRELEEYVMVLCHELRTPLAGTLGMLQLIQAQAAATPALYKDPASMEAEIERACAEGDPSQLREMFAQFVDPDGFNGGLHADLKLLKRMESCCMLQLAICDDLLEHHRANTGAGARSEPKVFRLKDLFEEVVGIVSCAMDNECDLGHLVTSKVCHYFRGEERRLKQVLIQMATNAVKADPQGRVTIEASLASDEQRMLVDDARGEVVCIEVRDRGCGMTPETVDRLMGTFSAQVRTPFASRDPSFHGGAAFLAGSPYAETTGVYTPPGPLSPIDSAPPSEAGSEADSDAAHNTPNGPVRSTGLGFGIFNVVIKHMLGGVLQVESQVGQGTNVRALVPLERATPPDTNKSPLRSRIPRPNLWTERQRNSPPTSQLAVLVAEDDPVIRDILVGLLRSLEQHNVAAARDGREAVEAVRKRHCAGLGRFDLVLMDHQMPRLCGDDAAREIRAFEQAHGLARARIVGISAFDAAETACLDAGMDQYETKPFYGDTLKRILDSSLAARPSPASPSSAASSASAPIFASGWDERAPPDDAPTPPGRLTGAPLVRGASPASGRRHRPKPLTGALPGAFCNLGAGDPPPPVTRAPSPIPDKYADLDTDVVDLEQAWANGVRRPEALEKLVASGLAFDPEELHQLLDTGDYRAVGKRAHQIAGFYSYLYAHKLCSTMRGLYWLRDRAPRGPEEALRVKAGVLAAAAAIERVQEELRSV